MELPEEAKKYFKYEEYGRDAVLKDRGQFTDQGYIYNNGNTFSQWYNGRENDIPKEYKVMSFPEPEHPPRINWKRTKPRRSRRNPSRGHSRNRRPSRARSTRLSSPPTSPLKRIKEITGTLRAGYHGLFEQ